MGDPKQTPNLNTKGIGSNSFDAIVIGSGISGGWAAKELCEKGLKTLVLERGPNVRHIKDYTTAFMAPWDFPFHLENTQKEKQENPIRSSASDEGDRHFYARDADHPFIQEKPFNWIRGYQVGGRSLTWGRQCYRLSDLDFEANAKDGFGVDWPIRYKDIAPWYDYVETFAGISGKAEGLPQLPDGIFLPPMEMTCVEADFADNIRRLYTDRIVTIGRVANLTQGWKGRGPCQFRNLCTRGCPFSGYFSSNAATLPAAELTGNMTLLPDSVVLEIIYDEHTRRASGVRVVNAITKTVTEYFARIIFLNASTIPSAAILLNSTSHSFPNGLGNSSNQVGHNLMDHFLGSGALGESEGFSDQYFSGRRPVGVYIPRFRNVGPDTTRKDFLRGYGLQGVGTRLQNRSLLPTLEGFGAAFRDKLIHPGPWTMWMGGWGETLPYYSNKVTLDHNQKDQWGLPLVKIDFEYHDNEHAMLKDIKESTREMLERTGFKNINAYSNLRPGGSAVHEMGTIRMGRDPKTSVLNGFNQMHEVNNVFVTDGSCMTSSATQNPSLTYMALTARACDFAVNELKKGNL